LTLDGVVLLAEEEEVGEPFVYNGKDYDNQAFDYHKNGFIYEAYNESQCV